MAELQTIAAILGLLKIAYNTGVFVKSVKDADQVAADIDGRLKRLASVLRGVKEVIRSRDAPIAESIKDGDADVASRIGESVEACFRTVELLVAKLGKLPDAADTRTGNFVGRVRLALRQPTITRINTELEARIQALSTDLAVLQLFDHQRTATSVLQAIARLGTRVEHGNKLWNRMMIEHGRQSVPGQNPQTVDNSPRAPDDPQDTVAGAIESLHKSLRAAEDVRERFTSEYAPDTRSIRELPSGIATPATGAISPDRRSGLYDWEYTVDDELPVDEAVMPLEYLDEYIQGYLERSRTEDDAGHPNQAVIHLNLAIQYSRVRQAYHGVPFTARAFMQEEMALLYQKQKKWAEAINCVHQLLRETSTSALDTATTEQVCLSQARQHKLLASIYHDRHLSNNGTALNLTSADIEWAEKHAQIAFNKRYEVYGRSKIPEDEVENHDACIQMLVRILDVQDKTVESAVLKRRLTSVSSSISGSTRRASTIQSQPPDNFEVVEQHDMLLEAINSKDSEQIQSLLTGHDLDLERLKAGKTFLMHAVETADESSVRRLLNPEVGAYVNTANRKGLTALHFAVMAQRHDMIRCLLDHDAEVLPQEPRVQAPIIKAVQIGDVTAVKIMADHDEETLQVKGGAEWSLLHYAATSEKAGTNMIRFLLDRRPELAEAMDQSGQTALHHCVDHERVEHVKALLGHQHRLDVHAKDSSSRTPLYFAASKPNIKAVRADMVLLLLEHGAAVDPYRVPLRLRDYEGIRRDPARRDSTLTQTSIYAMFALRRVAVRAISQQPFRQFSAIKSAPRISPFQIQKPSIYRSFHQSLRWAAEEDEKKASPAETQDASETVTVEPSAEEQAKEIKEESIATPEVADAAETTPSENHSATETAQEYASEAAETTKEYASDAAETAKEYASGAVESVKDAAASVAQTFGASPRPRERTERAPRERSDRAPRERSDRAPRERSERPARQWEERSENNPPSKILYVGNLFFEVTAPKLEAEFGRFGEIVTAKVVTDARGLSKGFAFVEFADLESANRAKQELNQTEFEGRRMSVQYHIKKERSQGFAPREGGTRNPPGKTLFIGNMSYQMSDRDLNDLFREVKNVLDVRVAIDRRSGQPRGFAHADFVDVESAQKAKELLEQKTVYGRQLRIDYSRESTPKSSYEE